MIIIKYENESWKYIICSQATVYDINGTAVLVIHSLQNIWVQKKYFVEAWGFRQSVKRHKSFNEENQNPHFFPGNSRNFVHIFHGTFYCIHGHSYYIADTLGLPDHTTLPPPVYPS